MILSQQMEFSFMANKTEKEKGGEITGESADVTKKELGVTGLKVASGYVFDEFLPELKGLRGRQKYREMADNDATVGALLLAFQMLLRNVELRVEPAEDDIENFYAEFVEDDLNTMQDSIEDVMSEILTFLTFGFSILELVYERNKDGTIGTKKLAPRAQETIDRWDLDDNGELRGLWQQPPMGGAEIYLPITKVLHFRTVLNKDNPEGRSILRNAYKNYHFIKNICMIEAIGIERDLNGLPVMYVPSKVLQDDTKKAQYLQLVRDVKFNEQGGVLLPSEPWPDDQGKPGNVRQYELTLLASEGTRDIDTDKIVKRHQADILRSVLADFLILGQGDKGSFALSKNKTDVFLKALEGFAYSICSVFEKRYLQNLWDFNNFPEEMKPCLKPGNIAPVDLQELGDFVAKLAGSGIDLSDFETENVLRSSADLPEITEEDAASREGLPEVDPPATPPAPEPDDVDMPEDE